jgi:hypothetical protein
MIIDLGTAVPVIRRPIRVAFRAVCGDHQRRIPSTHQRCSRGLGDHRIDFDADYTTPLADSSAQQCRVPSSAGPDFQHRMPRTHVQRVEHVGHDRGLAA